ncbi:hypothetical protein I3843_09G155200 [Carya illinoinensis]|nr:hypothetical protein I3843_09G155200 [Carya illinoinensis]
MKSKYFPSSNFQTTKVGSTPLFVWRSLLAARQIVEASSFWRLRTGEHIHLWKDKWAVKAKPAKVTSLVKEGEASVILKTPISTMNSMDKLIWHGIKDGSFLLRSAYHIEKTKEMAVKDQALTNNSFNEFNLFKKKEVSDPLCLICSREEESTLHCSKKLQKNTSSQLPMLVFFEALIKVLNATELQEFVVVARQLWLRKNSHIFNKVFLPPNCLLKETRLRLDMMSEDEKFSQYHNRGYQTCTSVDVWQAPPSNWLKVNWDGALDQAKGLIGIGVIIRDDKGQTKATMRQKKMFFPNPFLDESYGALVAAQFALDLRLSQIILEGDSLQVTKTLQEEKEAWSSSSMRNDNTMTHLLAKYALTIYDYILPNLMLQIICPLWAESID